MFCGEKSIVKVDPRTPDARVLRCRRWSCQDCLPLRRSEVVKLARAGEPQLMITLTSQRQEGQSPDDAAVALVRAWVLIVKRLKRLRKLKHVHYFAVIEATKLGWPHLHILTRLTFIEHAWLSNTAREIIGSPVVWLTRLRGNGHGAKYVAKYLGKAPHAFAGTKRYWRSQLWVVDVAAWREAHRKSPDRWRICDMSMQAVAVAMEASGYTASDLSNWAINSKCDFGEPQNVKAAWLKLRVKLWGFDA
jgi:hypothetical protein